MSKLTLELINELNKKNNVDYRVINGVLIAPRFAVPGKLFYLSFLDPFIACSCIIASDHEFIWPSNKTIEEVTAEIKTLWESTYATT